MSTMKRLVAALMVFSLGGWLGSAIPSSAAEQVIAIDILLEPDAIMLERARANNARLLKAYPQGFALDESHRPHITLVQRFVRSADLDKVYAAAGNVLLEADVGKMKLEAYKFYYAPTTDSGVAGIVAKTTPALLELQEKLIAAVAPLTVETAPISAFTGSQGDATADALLVGYVATFVPKQTGQQFSPHVSTGVASKAYLDNMLTEPFEPFTFSLAGAAVYQLGPFGTAAKRLKRLELRP